MLAATLPSVAVPDFKVVGIEPALAEVWLERFVTLLGSEGQIRLITARDISQVMGMARQRQMIGCNDTGDTCLSELAGALGVDGILSGAIAQAGGDVTASLRLLRASDGSVVWSATGRVGDQRQLQDWLESQVDRAAGAIRARLGTPELAAVPIIEAQRPPVRWQRLLPGVGGLVLAGVGTGFLVSAQGLRTRLMNERFDDATQIHAVASNGAAHETTGVVLVALAGAAVITSAVLLLLGSEPGSNVAVAVLPEGGAAMALSGSF